MPSTTDRRDRHLVEGHRGDAVPVPRPYLCGATPVWGGVYAWAFVAPTDRYTMYCPKRFCPNCVAELQRRLTDGEEFRNR